MKGKHISIKSAIDRLRNTDKEFLELFTHGSLSIEIYQPDKVDKQQPHSRDEVYIVANGSGKFYCDGKYYDFNSGDFLFVPAGVDHRFEEFSENFVTWVMFYGPEGGEGGNPGD